MNNVALVFEKGRFADRSETQAFHRSRLWYGRRIQTRRENGGQTEGIIAECHLNPNATSSNSVVSIPSVVVTGGPLNKSAEVGRVSVKRVLYKYYSILARVGHNHFQFASHFNIGPPQRQPDPYGSTSAAAKKSRVFIHNPNHSLSARRADCFGIAQATATFGARYLISIIQESNLAGPSPQSFIILAF